MYLASEQGSAALVACQAAGAANDRTATPAEYLSVVRRDKSYVGGEELSTLSVLYGAELRVWFPTMSRPLVVGRRGGEAGKPVVELLWDGVNHYDALVPSSLPVREMPGPLAREGSGGGPGGKLQKALGAARRAEAIARVEARLSRDERERMKGGEGAMASAWLGSIKRPEGRAVPFSNQAFWAAARLRIGLPPMPDHPAARCRCGEALESAAHTHTLSCAFLKLAGGWTNRHNALRDEVMWGLEQCGLSVDCEPVVGVAGEEEGNGGQSEKRADLVVTDLVGRRYLLDVTVTAIAHSGGVTLKQAFAKRTAEKTTKYQREAKERGMELVPLVWEVGGAEEEAVASSRLRRAGGLCSRAARAFSSALKGPLRWLGVLGKPASRFPPPCRPYLGRLHGCRGPE